MGAYENIKVTIRKEPRMKRWERNFLRLKAQIEKGELTVPDIQKIHRFKELSIDQATELIGLIRVRDGG